MCVARVRQRDNLGFEEAVMLGHRKVRVHAEQVLQVVVVVVMPAELTFFDQSHACRIGTVHDHSIIQPANSETQLTLGIAMPGCLSGWCRCAGIRACLTIIIVSALVVVGE